MSPDPARYSSRRAVTLIELIVAVSIVVVLCLALGIGLKQWRYSKNRAESIAVMHHIGMALAQYTSEHDQLPSPLWSYQSPRYGESSTLLIYHLAPYLQTTETNKDGDLLPGYVPEFLRQWYTTRKPSSPSIYMLKSSVETDDGRTIYLWGYPSGDNGPIAPARWAALGASLPLSTTVALADWTTADQVTPSQKAHDLPSAFELQNYKTRLFLDWHVETAQIN